MAGEDVVLICIGAGFAGLTAALRASELGLKAIVLERQPEAKHYNNSRITTGVFHVASHDVRLAPEKLIEAINVETQNYAKPDLVRTIAETALPQGRVRIHRLPSGGRDARLRQGGDPARPGG